MEQSFRIANCPRLGDYIIASRDFEEGDLIFQEEPIITSPVKNFKVGQSEFCCVGCFKILPGNSHQCPSCLFPVCSFPCTQERLHSQLECKIFKQKNISPSPTAYHFIKYVRILQSRSVYPKQYQQFMQLATEFSVGEERTISAGNEEGIAAWNFLTEVCDLDVSISEVKEMWRAVKINAFVIPAEDQSGKPCRGLALFEYGCKLSHSCSSNLQWYLQKDELVNGSIQWLFTVFSTRAIKKGDILSINYSAEGMDSGTAHRRELASLIFDCFCSRCLDPTEDGTFISSPKCRECKQGYLLPKDPLSSINCPWNCSKCDSEIMGCDITKKIDELEEYISPLMKQEVSEHSLETLDRFIEEHSGTYLHPNHFLLFQTSYHWLTKSNFREKLMSHSKSSGILFEKIVSRAQRCLQLAGMFLHMMRTVHLELSVMDAVVAFGFKSPDGVNVYVSHLDHRKKLQFSNIVLKHLSRARFWLVRHRMDQHMESHKATLDELHSHWISQRDSFAMDLVNFEKEAEESALVQLSSLFN